MYFCGLGFLHQKMWSITLKPNIQKYAPYPYTRSPYPTNPINQILKDRFKYFIFIWNDDYIWSFFFFCVHSRISVGKWALVIRSSEIKHRFSWTIHRLVKFVNHLSLIVWLKSFIHFIPTKNMIHLIKRKSLTILFLCVWILPYPIVFSQKIWS